MFVSLHKFLCTTWANIRLKFSATRFNYLWWGSYYIKHTRSVSLLWVVQCSKQLYMWCRENLMPIITKESISGKISLEMVLALVIDFLIRYESIFVMTAYWHILCKSNKAESCKTATLTNKAVCTHNPDQRNFSTANTKQKLYMTS